MVSSTTGAPAHQSGELSKVVNGQPEHVIGAHPRTVNVLQEETLMETHDGVVVYLRTQRTSRGSGHRQQLKISRTHRSQTSCGESEGV